MYRKSEERRQNFSSEFRNAFFVRNKCEQLKLEKQHKSLDRLRVHETLDLLNKKKEILSLQMSILSSKLNKDNNERLGIKEELSQPEVDINANDTRKMKLRSRALSISASRISTFLSSSHGHGKESQLCASSLTCSARGEKLSFFKKRGRSFSVCGNLDIVARRNLPKQQCKNDDQRASDSGDLLEEDKSSSRRAIWELLPPIQLAPLHKQKSRSLKNISSRTHLKVPMSESPTTRKVSWDGLQDCRYLRGKNKSNSCSES